MTGRRHSKALLPLVGRCGRGRCELLLLLMRSACLPATDASVGVTIGQRSLVTSSWKQRGAAGLAVGRGTVAKRMMLRL